MGEARQAMNVIVGCCRSLSRICLVDQRISFVIQCLVRLMEALVDWEISGWGERDAACCFGSADVAPKLYPT